MLIHLLIIYINLIFTYVSWHIYTVELKHRWRKEHWLPVDVCGSYRESHFILLKLVNERFLTVHRTLRRKTTCWYVQQIYEIKHPSDVDLQILQCVLPQRFVSYRKTTRPIECHPATEEDSQANIPQIEINNWSAELMLGLSFASLDYSATRGQ